MTSLEERFHAKYQVVEPGGCWIWMAALTGGYGRFTVGRNLERAHRVSWKLHKGPIPEGLLVLHHCDIRSCVNPDHLFIGTPMDNTQDMWRKGRGRGPTKLTDDDVRAIRNFAGTLKHYEIADLFGVSKSYISYIVNHTKRGDVQ